MAISTVGLALCHRVEPPSEQQWLAEHVQLHLEPTSVELEPASVAEAFVPRVAFTAAAASLRVGAEVSAATAVAAVDGDVAALNR
jgi:hypothetical protein